jgi:hypothetical protein
VSTCPSSTAGPPAPGTAPYRYQPTSRTLVSDGTAIVPFLLMPVGTILASTRIAGIRTVQGTLAR